MQRLLAPRSTSATPLTPFRSRLSPQGSAQARTAHPLLGAFPLAVMTLATFLVAFTLTMARLNAGADPDLRPSTSTSLVAISPGAGAVTTRTSGGGASAAAATPVAAAEQSSGTTAAIGTRAAGVPGTAEAGDD